MAENIPELLAKMGIDGVDGIEPVRHEEDDSCYAVWKVKTKGNEYILKKAKGYEASVYSLLLKNAEKSVPRILNSLSHEGNDYLLMESVRGADLCKCDRRALTLALDALICLQDQYWEKTEYDSAAISFEESLQHRQNRGKFLRDGEIEAAYEAFLAFYKTLPRTLCHDDLLPFNVIVTEHEAKLLDWEAAGILPYPVSLARLIAHGAENADAFFYMTKADKQFAIDYYYDRLLKDKGICYSDYRRALDHFLLYEYCEWIMLGVKYPDADMSRYREYLAKAREHIQNSVYFGI